MKVREPNGNDFDAITERCATCDGHWRHYPGCRLYAENEVAPRFTPEEAETVVLCLQNHIGRLASALKDAWGADRQWDINQLVERIHHVRGTLTAMGRKDIADGYDARPSAELRKLGEKK